MRHASVRLGLAGGAGHATIAHATGGRRQDLERAYLPGSATKATAPALAACLVTSNAQSEVYRNMMADSRLPHEQRGIV